MLIKILDIIALIIASCIVMILHEIPKTILFFQLENRKNILKETFRIKQYIDPIGLLFCMAGYSGFSKGYMLRAKTKKTNFLLGITGLLSLFIIGSIGIISYRYYFGQLSPEMNINNIYEILSYVVPFLISKYIAVIGVGMFLVNLFPLAAFDMGLIIGGISLEKYFSVLRNDYLIKMILIISMILGIVRFLSTSFVGFFLGIS